MGELAAVGKEVGEGWVGVAAVLVVLKGFEGRVFLVRVPGGEVVRIFGGDVAVLVALFGVGIVADRGNFLVRALVDEILGLDYLGDGDAFCGRWGHFGFCQMLN